MKILIDIGHPKHVHFFRNMYRLFKEKGHEILITCRDKDVNMDLLEKYNIPYISRGKGSNSIVGKILYMLVIDVWLLFVALRFRPDIMLGFSSIYPSHVSMFIKAPYYCITDTEHTMENKLFAPFSKYVITPKCFRGSFGKKHVTFDSYLELAYLHPKYFQPDKTVLKKLNVDEGEIFSIVRFVSWNASHDIGHTGISMENKIKVVDALLKYGKVFISSEDVLPDDLVINKFPLHPVFLHDVMYYASLLYGESATMASEAAIMGVPAIFHNNVGCGYTFELEKDYGHVYNYTESEEDQRRGIERANMILSDPKSKELALKAAERIIHDKISTTDYLINFIEKRFFKSNKDDKIS